MGIFEMNALAESYPYIYKYSEAPAHSYFTIGPFESNSYLVEMRVHYIFDNFAYISFTTLNGKQDAPGGRIEPENLQTIYYRNNRFIENLIADRKYEWKISDFKTKFIFEDGYIISRCDRRRIQCECLICFEHSGL